MQEHVNDPYVLRAKADGWRARAAFKLLEIDDRDKLIKPGMTVVDLGSTPGSWSQVAAKRLGGNGRILAMDMLPMDPIRGVTFIQGDFREDQTLLELTKALDGRLVDLVLSDMAPNMTGIGSSDQARVMYLAELTLDFCNRHLKPGGDLLVKVFQGSGYMELRKAVDEVFETLLVRKPAASRDKSAEVYLLGRSKRHSGELM
ncbi:MAG: RlmE family RNA methyltransferase [Rhodocyclaceae bacterium]|nr:RlmE family RNA methyltransferase [Rhodocyclaceae bacterium]MBP7080096.1 RlmE family RNA methyltransferase [Rhodocyclaceae bacterium]